MFDDLMTLELIIGVSILSVILRGVELSTLRASIGILFLVEMIIIGGYINTGCANFFVINYWTIICKFIILVSSYSVLLMGIRQETLISPALSGPTLVLVLVLSSLLLVSSINWLAIYLSAELQTLVSSILVALNRKGVYSTEASIKYFVLGAVSSGLLLLGCVLLYGSTGSISIQEINSNLIADVGKVLITISLLFKLSVTPFHMWAPDVYEGAPTIVTALLITAPKVGIFSILIQIGPVTNVTLVCAIASIVCGAIGGLNQTRVKRLLAYSGIGHVGFILFGAAIGSFESIQAGLVYITIYVLISICSFCLLLLLDLTEDLIVEMIDRSKLDLVISLTLVFVFFSAVGVPPLSGFLSKWLILLSGLSSGYPLICSIVVMSSVLTGAYYLRVVQIMYFKMKLSLSVWRVIFKGRRQIDLKRSVLIGWTLFIVLFLIYFPNLILQVTHDGTVSLY